MSLGTNVLSAASLGGENHAKPVSESYAQH